MTHESDGDTNCNWGARYRIGKDIAGFGNNWTNKDHSNSSTIKIGLNTGMSPGNSKRLAVIQTPVKNHLLTLV